MIASRLFSSCRPALHHGWRAVIVMCLAAALLLQPGAAPAASAGSLASQPPPVRLVADINTGSTLSIESDLIPYEDYLYFRGYEADHGIELWRYDPNGSDAFELAADIVPGVGSSQPGGFVEMAGILYFWANGEGTGRELWAYNDDTQEAWLVKDIWPGENGQQNGAELVMARLGAGLEAALYFRAEDGSTGGELWKSDGTSDGTVRVKDLNASGSSNPRMFTRFQGQLYFTTVTSINGTTKAHLWRTDGTGLGTQMLNEFDNINSLFAFPQSSPTMLILAASSGYSNTELWRHTAAPSPLTELVADIRPPVSGQNRGSSPWGFTAMGSHFYFAANDGTHGQALWKSDGSTAALVADINPGTGPYDAFGMLGAAAPGGSAWLFFSVDDGSHGQELWKTDGTTAGTVMVKDIFPGASASFPEKMVSMGNTLYFRASDILGQELWMSDGTEAGTVQAADLKPGAASGSPDHLYPAGDRLYFASSVGVFRNSLCVLQKSGVIEWQSFTGNGGGNGPSDPSDLTALGSRVVFSAYREGIGEELWASDGTESGTSLLRDIQPGVHSSSPGGLTRIGDSIVFGAYHYETGTELWKTDGTTGGTVLLKELVPGLSSYANLDDFTAVDGMPGGAGPDQTLVFFTGVTEDYKRHLWRTDGTPGGTQQIIKGGSTLVLAQLLRPNTGGRGVLFFSGTTSSSSEGYELWKTDGTAAGTVRVKDIQAGAGSSYPGEMVVFQGRLFFQADDGATGPELWVSDGTEGGTALIKNIATIDPGQGGQPQSLTVVGGSLFFNARTDETGYELWKTDGTPGGTVMVREIDEGSGDSDPTELTAFNGKLYFAADDGANGTELWMSDGTPGGTVMVKDIYPGEEGSSVDLFSINGQALYLYACEPDHGCELWETQGSGPTTRMVADLEPGPGDSSPYNMAWVGAKAFFSAYSSPHNIELWLLDTGFVYIPLVMRR